MYSEMSTFFVGKVGEYMYFVLKILMKQKGVTQLELAEMMGVSKQCLSHKINGKSQFTLDECLKIKECLKYDGTIETLFQKINGAC